MCALPQETCQVDGWEQKEECSLLSKGSWRHKGETPLQCLGFLLSEVGEKRVSVWGLSKGVDHI